MDDELRHQLLAGLERPHRLGMIGGNLEEQLAHSAGFSSVLTTVTAERGVRLERGVDLGTGGGLPGVALAALRPAMRWTLVDMRSGRATEVERTVLRLEMADRVEVLTGQAQTFAHEPTMRESYDVVVARAFGQPSLAAECAAGFLAAGGVFVVSEPPDPPPDRWNTHGLERLGLSLPRYLSCDSYRFAAFTKLSPAPPSVPRLPARPNRGWF